MRQRHPKNAKVGTIKNRELGLEVDVYCGNEDRSFFAYFPNQEAPTKTWHNKVYVDLEREVEQFYGSLREVIWHPYIKIVLDMPWGLQRYNPMNPAAFAGFKLTRFWKGELTNPILAGTGRIPYTDGDPETGADTGVNIWYRVQWENHPAGIDMPFTAELWESLKHAEVALKNIHAFLATVQDLGAKGQTDQVAALFMGPLLPVLTAQTLPIEEEDAG